MDHEALSHQARAALDSLTYQLQSLEYIPPSPSPSLSPSHPNPNPPILTSHNNREQQSALLTSLLLTTDSLSPIPLTGTPTSIPNYHLISPILSLIPTYTAKLTRLRNTMSSQTLEITQLRRRAEEIKRGRRRNLERVRERWERERERDRTVLRARVAGVMMGEEVGGVTPKVVEEIGGGGGGDVLAMATAVPFSGAPATATPTSQMPPQGAPEGSGIRVVKRKKKVRQAEMQ